MNYNMDAQINIARDGDIRLLQITDMQVIDSDQQRRPDRLREEERVKWLPDTKEKNLYRYIRELVARAKPDLIFITGDITYGEFDDTGRSQTEFIEFMEQFGIPWAPVYGNHDNETTMGIDWQNAQYEAAPHCLFQKGSVSGNGNYSVGICQNGALIRTLCMMDSNGCGKLGIPAGFREDQLAWLEAAAGENNVPAFVCFHIPNTDVSDALVREGYQPDHDSRDTQYYFELGKDIPAHPGDFGRKCDFTPRGGAVSIREICQKCGIDGVFLGHQHKNSISFVSEGIRYTFGMKTGTYDYHFADAMGGTLITLRGGDFTVEHLPCAIS